MLWGEPGAVYAELQVSKKPNGPLARWVQYTPAAWRWFLDGLREYPYGAVIAIVPLDGRGRPATPEGVPEVQVTRPADAPRRATFSFRAGAAVADPARVASECAAFARQQADAMHAVYADIGHDSPGYTLLEYATGAWPEQTIPQARSQLRGYSWATLVPPELVGALDGIGVLRQSGEAHMATVLRDDASVRYLTVGDELPVDVEHARAADYLIVREPAPGEPVSLLLAAVQRIKMGATRAGQLAHV